MDKSNANEYFSDRDQMLEESELKYYALFQAMTQGVVYQDRTGRIVKVNKAAENALGFGAEHLNGHIPCESGWQTFNEDGSLLPDEEHPAMIALHTGSPVYNKILRVNLPGNNRFHWLDVTSIPLFRNHDTVPYEILTLFTDITDRKEAEDNLEEIKERLQAFADATYEGIAIHDNGVILEANTQFAQIHGIESVSELIGRSVLEFAPDEFKPIVQEHIQEGRTDSYEAMAYRADNTLFPVEIQGRKFSYKGKILRVTAIRDITDRKMVELALNEKERMLETLISNLPGMVYRCRNDKDWTMEYLSEGCLSLTGYHPSEFIENTNLAYANIILPDDREMVWETVQEGIEKKSAYQILFRIRTKLGGIRWVWEQGKGIFDDSGQLITLEGFVTDITDRVAAENALEAKNKELEQIVYVTSHDLRSPLVNIQGYSKELELALSSLVDILSGLNIFPEQTIGIKRIIDEDIFESLKFIKSSIIKMESLLSGLLRLSRSGTTALKIETVDMNDLISKVMANFEYVIKSENVALEIIGLPPCKADTTLVNQVFSNLIDNALKYLSPERTGLIKIRGWKEVGWAVYSVEDNGIGIAQDQTCKIFDIFYRFNPKGKSGEGLGLTIVQKMVERLNGNISVESELGHGSRFLIYLPGI